MTLHELAEAGNLIDLLRSKGVKRFEGGGFIIELGDAPNGGAAETTPRKPPPSPFPLCTCGHALHAHVDGLCTEACEPERCVEKAPEASA